MMEDESGMHEYGHDEGLLEYIDEGPSWREQRMSYVQDDRMLPTTRPVLRMARPMDGSHYRPYRPYPVILRKTAPSHHSIQHVSTVRPTTILRLVKKEDKIPVLRDIPTTSHDDLPVLEPYANEETVQTSEVVHDGLEEEEESLDPKRDMRRDSLPYMHYDHHPTGHSESSQLRMRVNSLAESNNRMRQELLTLREERRETLKQLRRAEKIIEKQAVDVAQLETLREEMVKREREREKNDLREAAKAQKRKKMCTVMPCLPCRKVAFSAATKQAQSLRVRMLNRYLSELCGPVAPERKLEEKNIIVLRWRKNHAPRPSLEIGRQLSLEEDEEFCKKFNIDANTRKAMKKYLGHKNIDLFGPSERAMKVRQWRQARKERMRKGEMVDGEEELMGEGVTDEDIEEAGDDTDEEDLMADIEEAMENEDRQEEEDHIRRTRGHPHTYRQMNM